MCYFLTLPKINSFKEYVKWTESENKGNYLEYLYHRAQYVEKLRVRSENSTIFVGTFHGFHNNLIRSTSTLTMSKIWEAKRSAFVSIIKDDSVDVTGEFQLSSFLRCVAPDSNIQEWFMWFSDVSNNRFAAFSAGSTFNRIN